MESSYNSKLISPHENIVQPNNQFVYGSNINMNPNEQSTKQFIHQSIKNANGFVNQKNMANISQLTIQRDHRESLDKIEIPDLKLNDQNEFNNFESNDIGGGPLRNNYSPEKYFFFNFFYANIKVIDLIILSIIN